MGNIAATITNSWLTVMQCRWYTVLTAKSTSFFTYNTVRSHLTKFQCPALKNEAWVTWTSCCTPRVIYFPTLSATVTTQSTNGGSIHMNRNYRFGIICVPAHGSRDAEEATLLQQNPPAATYHSMKPHDCSTRLVAKKTVLRFISYKLSTGRNDGKKREMV